MIASPQPREATLIGPNGRRVKVVSGSTQAKQLMGQGWGLAGYRAPAAASPTTPAAAASTPESITSEFIRQLTPLFTPATKPAVTPFDQAGFYNEGDTKAAADQEYDPYYAKLQGYQDVQNTEGDRQRALQNAMTDREKLEQVNASGGYGSSAYQKEMADTGTLRQSDYTLRQQALQKAQTDQDSQKRIAKEQFVQSRRGEAYQRYLQSIGATATA